MYENFEFLDKFAISLYKMSDLINQSLEDFNGNKTYNQQEITVLLTNSLIIVQRLKAVEFLEQEKMYISAFDVLRSLIESIRLTKLLVDSKEFRKKYISNSNTDFTGTMDREFTQNKVTKELNKLFEEWIKYDEKRNIRSFNHSDDTYKKGGVLSRQHSKFSKYSHLTNVNLTVPYYLEKVDEKMGINLSQFRNVTLFSISLKKQIVENIFIIQHEIVNLFEMIGIFLIQSHGNLYFSTLDEIYDHYQEFIDRFYK